MAETATPADLKGVLDGLQETADEADCRVSVDDVLAHLGRRSFGILLLLPAIIAFTPAGGIPGLPSAMAAFVILIAGQVLFARDSLWLPGFVARRTVKADTLKRAVKILSPVAKVIDKLLKPRLQALTEEPYIRASAALCILVSLTIPPLEILPLAGSASWAAIGAFALALIAHDGLLAVLAAAFTAGAAYLVVSLLL